MATKQPSTTVIMHLSVDHLGIDRLKELFPNVSFVIVDPSEPIDANLQGEVLVTGGGDPSNLAEILTRGVKWIHCPGHGVDNLPLELVGTRLLTCARGATAIPIAEWVMAMLLSAIKRLPYSWSKTPPPHWYLSNLDTLQDATVALIGYGSINQAVAYRLAPFGCKIIATRRSNMPVEEHNVEVVSNWETAVADADHVVIGVPATPATTRMVDTRFLSACKNGAHIVNVARGAIIDQDALRNALDLGQIGLASLDVCEPEPLPEGHWLYQHPSVRLSPHLSWSSPYSLNQIAENFSANLERWLNNRPLANLVDVNAGY